MTAAKPPYSPSGEGSETAENVTYHRAAEAALLAEIEALRDVLVFADGATKATGYALADLYAEDSPAQGVLRRAGCHPRTVKQAKASERGRDERA